MRFYLAFVGWVVAASAQPSFASDQKRILPQRSEVSIYQVIASNPDFSILRTLLERADLSEKLAGPGNWTLLAPTNEAFRRLPKRNLKEILARGDLASVVVENLVTPQRWSSVSFFNGLSLIDQPLRHVMSPVSSFPIIACDYTKGLQFNDRAKILQMDVYTSNGFVHVVDSLVPILKADSVAPTPQLGALEKMGLVVTPNPAEKKYLAYFHP